MPVPTHFRFVFRGDFVGTPEQWSFSMHFSRDNPSSADSTIDDIDTAEVTTACAAFFNTAAAMIPPAAKMTDWRAYQIGTDNRMEGNPLVVDVSGDSIAGIGSTIYPPQIAMVVTTVGADRGPARLGRFYLPTRAVLDGTMRQSAASALGVAEAASTFMKSVSNAIDLDLSSSSAGLNISARGPSGAKQVIDHIEVGRVFDTLRNRRKSMLEERESTGNIDW